MSLTFRSTKLLDELRRRKQEFSQSIRARIRVPSDLRWWYWQEFGVPHSYPIRPINAKMLVFPDTRTGATVITPYVTHPGLKPRRMVSKVLEPIGQMAARNFASAMVTSRYQAEVVRSALTDIIMPDAKQQIVESFALELPGTRVDGRLEGQSASQVFDAEAVIVTE